MNEEIPIAGLVILYNPDVNVLDNIHTYLPSLDKLYIIDNSENTSAEYYTNLGSEKVIYHYNKGNIGVAAALNKGIRMAIADNYDYCILFDQDTSAATDLMTNVKAFLNLPKFENIGIFSAVPHYANNKTFKKDEYLDVAISSGGVLSLKAFKDVGPFLEKLFVDYVDFEYCLRLRKKGYKILQINEALIYHSLGNLERKYFLFKDIFITNHQPARYYYRTRNRFYVYREYFLRFPSFVLKDLIVFVNELVKIILYESDKRLKFKMIRKGFIDFLFSNYGKLR